MTIVSWYKNAKIKAEGGIVKVVNVVSEYLHQMPLITCFFERDVLECGITVTMTHRAINARLHEEKLPPLNYTISTDSGGVEVEDISK
jgi:hypothetical protein